MLHGVDTFWHAEADSGIMEMIVNNLGLEKYPIVTYAMEAMEEYEAYECWYVPARNWSDESTPIEQALKETVVELAMRKYLNI